jgi:hypothetical protein
MYISKLSKTGLATIRQANTPVCTFSPSGRTDTKCAYIDDVAQPVLLARAVDLGLSRDFSMMSQSKCISSLTKQSHEKGLPVGMRGPHCAPSLL